MEKVICIDIAGLADIFPPIVEGNRYTVEKISINGNYALKEVPDICPIDNDRYYYSRHRFVPCSSISETEMTREYKKELA